MKKAENMLLDSVRGKRHVVGINPDGVVLTRSDINNAEEECRERRDRLESIYNGRTR